MIERKERFNFIVVTSLVSNFEHVIVKSVTILFISVRNIATDLLISAAKNGQ